MRYLLLLFFVVLSCKESTTATKLETEKSEAESDTLKGWLIYGLGTSLEAENYIAKDYGFKYEQISGCITTKNISDSADNHNKKLERDLSIKFGTNWKKHFNLRVEKFKEKLSEAYSILYEYKPFNTEETKLRAENYFITTNLNTVDSSLTKFKIDVYKYADSSTEKRKSKTQFIKISVYEIDINKKLVVTEI